MRARRARLRSKIWQVIQCAIAAGIAWTIAADLLDHPQPFLAPVVALVALGTSYGQRLRRVAEMAVAVAVGVLLGDAFTLWVGTGGWQIALLVGVAMTTALLMDASTLLVNQVAVQALVVVTILPDPDRAFVRWTDALIGGAVAIVAASVVPRAPLRRPLDSAAVVVRRIAQVLRECAERVGDGDATKALATLRSARTTTDALIRELQTAADEGMAVVRSSPFRYRHRGRVRTVAELVEPLDFSLRTTRVLARWIAVACYRRQPIPAGYQAFLVDLAAAADEVADRLAAGEPVGDVQDRLIALGVASTGLERTSVLPAEVVLAQSRAVVADLLAVSGMDPLVATDHIPPIS